MIRAAVAQNPCCPVDLLEMLSFDRDGTGLVQNAVPNNRSSRSVPKCGLTRHGSSPCAILSIKGCCPPRRSPLVWHQGAGNCVVRVGGTEHRRWPSLFRRVTLSRVRAICRDGRALGKAPARSRRRKHGVRQRQQTQSVWSWKAWCCQQRRRARTPPDGSDLSAFSWNHCWQRARWTFIQLRSHAADSLRGCSSDSVGFPPGQFVKPEFQGASTLAMTYRLTSASTMPGNCTSG